MPFETGFVPSDGYRHYIHGSSQKMEFGPCGHSIEDYYDADSKSHTHPFYNRIIEDIRKQQAENFLRARASGQTKSDPFFPKYNGLEGVECPRCGSPVEEIRYWFNNDIEEMAESKFKAYRIMGWL